jgi:hypothetical protein
MVDKKAGLCGLDGAGVRLANVGEICSDAGGRLGRTIACQIGRGEIPPAG